MVFYMVGTLASCMLAVWMQKQDALLPGEVSARRRWQKILLCGLPLTLLSAIRWGPGTDFYYTYLPEFRALQWLRAGGGEQLCEELFRPLLGFLNQTLGLHKEPEGVLQYYLRVLSKSEPGYRALMELDVLLGGQFRVVVAVTSVIIGVCVFYAIFTQSTNPVLAIYLYVATSNYFLSLNIVRQYVAIAIGLVALQFAKERRLWAFLLCVALAMTFHTTAVLLLPCYFLGRVELKPRYAVLLVALTFTGSGVLGTAAAWLMPRIGLGYYARYLGSKWDDGRLEVILLAINLCVLLFSSWYWSAAKKRCPYFILWYNMTLLGTLALALSGVLPLMKRVNYYYAAPQFLLLPEVLQAEEDAKRRRILTVLIVLAFAAETIVAVGIYNKNGVLPYQVRAGSNG